MSLDLTKVRKIGGREYEQKDKNFFQKSHKRAVSLHYSWHVRHFGNRHARQEIGATPRAKTISESSCHPRHADRFGADTSATDGGEDCDLDQQRAGACPVFAEDGDQVINNKPKTKEKEKKVR